MDWERGTKHVNTPGAITASAGLPKYLDPRVQTPRTNHHFLCGMKTSQGSRSKDWLHKWRLPLWQVGCLECRGKSTVAGNQTQSPWLEPPVLSWFPAEAKIILQGEIALQACWFTYCTCITSLYWSRYCWGNNYQSVGMYKHSCDGEQWTTYGFCQTIAGWTVNKLYTLKWSWKNHIRSEILSCSRKIVKPHKLKVQ